MKLPPDPETDIPAPAAALGQEDRVAAWLAQGLGLVSVACITAMLILTAANVIGRYLLNAPIRGAEELTGFLIVATLMFGASEAHRRGEHIAVDLFEGTFSPKVARLLAILGQVAVIIVAAAIAWTGWHTVQFSRSFGIYSPGYMQIPMWIPQMPLVIGGISLAVVAALRLISLMRRRS